MTLAVLIALCILAAFVIRRIIDIRKVLDTIQHHPGRRFFLSVIDFPGYLAGTRIPWIVAGNNAEYEYEYKDFERYGYDIISEVFFYPKPNPVFYVADAEAVKEITANRARFPKPVKLYEMLSFYGKNIVASEGDEWKKYRKISAPSFSERNNRLVWDETVQLVLSLFDDVWGSQKEVKVDNFLGIALSLTLFIISSAGFGQRISWKNNGIRPVGHKMSFKEAIYTVSEKLILKLAVPKMIMDLEVTENLRSIKIGFNELHNHMLKMIQSRKTAEKREGRYDLLSSLLDANEEESDGTSKLSDSELVGNIFIFLIAGHETTAHTLAFAFALLALYPEEQQKLYEQTKSVMGDSDIPRYEDLGAYTYALAVLYETLRFFPAVTGIPKVSEEDTTLMTHNRHGERVPVFIPKGSNIIINTPALHRNPRYWEDPYAFKPSRFLADWPREAFLPFSGGVRACLGKRFAETEAIATITMLVARYKVEILEEPQFVGETFEQRKNRVLACHNAITLTPTRVPLVFKRR